MQEPLTPDVKEVMDAATIRPAVSIIMPFEPKMNLATELSYALKIAVDKVEKEIAGKYMSDAGMQVVQKLRMLIKDLNFSTHKKSIAIYVSPKFEKVLYLDIPVEERITVDESFEIRDLIYARKQLHKYLVLLLSFNGCDMYLGDTTTFVKIISNSGKSAHDYDNDIAERVANFSDLSERKEILLEKLLHHIDDDLGIVLNAYRLPLFVVGTKRIAGHFKKITRHGSSVVSYIHGNYNEAGAAELKEVLQPHVNDWKAVLNKDLMNRINEAYGKHQLAYGMKNVWQEAMGNKGRLLIVEKNYMYPALHSVGKERQVEKKVLTRNRSYIHDAVDKVIEKVLESGGDVEFVDTGVLKDYDHIALVLYY